VSAASTISVASVGFTFAASSIIALATSIGTGFGFDECCRGGRASRPTLTATQPHRFAWSSTRHNST
jgi:hypothetical protein